MAAGKRYTLKTKAISLCVYYTKWLREKYSSKPSLDGLIWKIAQFTLILF